MSDFIYGIRQASRSFRRAPGFTLLCVSILAVGIGSTTLMFSLVQTVLLRDLPFTDPDRLVWMYNARTERNRAPLSVPDVEDYRRQSSTLAGLAVFTNWAANLTGVGSPERLEGTRVSGDFFQLLGVRARIGRVLEPGDEKRDARVVVLTHGVWIRRFGGDAGIVGRGLSLNGTTYIVVGVLPERFLFPFRDAEMAVPLSLETDLRRTDRGANFLRVVARLAPGVSVTQAESDLNAIAARLQRAYPEEDARKIGITLYPLHAEIVRDYRGMLWMLFGSVGVLLLVGCVNLANLLLARTADRQTEFTVRLALGASRQRLARQLLGETALLAAVGGTAGVGLSVWGLAAWQMWGPVDFPQMREIGLDPTVLLFAATVSSLTACASGIVPIMFAANGTIRVKEGRTMTAVGRQIRLQRIFVGAQVAAAAVLLIGMSLMTQGLAHLERVSPGFLPDRTLAIQLSLPPGVYAKREALVGFVDALSDRLAAAARVEQSGIVSLLPLSGLLSAVDIRFPDKPAPPPDEVPQAHFRIASPGYFAAAGLPIIEGRAFADHDRANTAPVAIVSQTFAARHWPGERAIGKRVQIVQSTASPAIEIVGIAGDVKHFTLDAPATADLYVPLRQMPLSQAPLLASRMYLLVRAQSDPARLIADVRDTINHVDPGVAASGARTLQAILASSLGPRRLNVRLLRFFGGVAAVLCSIGIYGVAAFSACARRREIAIRLALGANPRALTRTILRPEITAVVLGLGVGLATSSIAAPLVFGTAYDMNPRDVPTYAGVAVVLLSVGLAATYLPVRQTRAVHPAELLAQPPGWFN